MVPSVVAAPTSVMVVRAISRCACARASWVLPRPQSTRRHPNALVIAWVSQFVGGRFSLPHERDGDEYPTVAAVEPRGPSASV